MSATSTEIPSAEAQVVDAIERRDMLRKAARVVLGAGEKVALDVCEVKACAVAASAVLSTTESMVGNAYVRIAHDDVLVLSFDRLAEAGCASWWRFVEGEGALEFLRGLLDYEDQGEEVMSSSLYREGKRAFAETGPASYREGVLALYFLDRKREEAA